MKLQLWTTVDSQADDMLGEIDVDDETWEAAQSGGADALELIQALASELGSDCL